MVLTINKLFLLLTHMLLHLFDVLLVCSVSFLLSFLLRFSYPRLGFFPSLFVLPDLEIAFIVFHTFIVLDIGLSYVFLSQFASFHHSALVGDVVYVATQTFPFGHLLFVAGEPSFVRFPEQVFVVAFRLEIIVLSGLRLRTLLKLSHSSFLELDVSVVICQHE